MSYSLFVEGLDGANRVRQGRLPSRGEWINLRIDGVVWWLPVLEVAHVLTPGEAAAQPDHGCSTTHRKAHEIALTSLGAGVRADVVDEDDVYKLILPPSRWPLGGRTVAPRRSRNGEGGEWGVGETYET